MTKISKILSFCLGLSLLASCSQVLQSVDLNIDAEDNSFQEEFNVVERTLTIKEAKAQNTAPYLRTVLSYGRGQSALTIPEKLALKSELPNNNKPLEYKIGIGDSITFSRLTENNQSTREKVSKWPPQEASSNYTLGIGDTLALTLIRNDKTINQLTPNNSNNNQNLIINSQQTEVTINSKGRIGSDGSVLLLEVGRLEAIGKSLNELRSEVRNIFIRNGVSPRFQLEIVEFVSQRAYLTVASKQGLGSRIINLSDQEITLLDALTQANISYQPGIKTLVKLKRKDDLFSMNLRDVFNKEAPKISIIDRDHIFVEESTQAFGSSVSRVDHKGNIVLDKLGEIKAAGRSLDEVHTDIKSLLKPIPGSQNAFQIQVTDFASQKALLTIQGKPGVLIPITNTPETLAEVLTKNGLSIDVNHITQINLQRGANTFVFTLDDLLDPKSPDVFIQPDDRLTTTNLPYKENKVFVLGAVSPQIFKINPANRETLADVLFTSGGPLSASDAKRSEVYLLRGSNPVVAYHLDAQSPTRLIVADALELRPNDILYVAEQPIISFNRTLATIFPLRILLRDIQDENIP